MTDEHREPRATTQRGSAAGSCGQQRAARPVGGAAPAHGRAHRARAQRRLARHPAAAGFPPRPCPRARRRARAAGPGPAGRRPGGARPAGAHGREPGGGPAALPDAARSRPPAHGGRRSGAGAARQAASHDVVFVVADGLSARAVQSHAAPLLAQALPALRAEGWRIAPLVVARHGRVAIGDPIAAALRADIVAVLIGERPGLSAPDSMGAYLTWQPGPQIDRCRPQLHLQHPARGRRLRGRRLQAAAPAARHALAPTVGRAAQGRFGSPADQRPVMTGYGAEGAPNMYWQLRSAGSCAMMRS